MSRELTAWGRVARAWQRYSAKQFLGLVFYNLKLLLTGKYWQHSHLFDDTFDRTYNVETRGTEETEYLTADAGAKEHGRRYEAATVEQMALLMGKLSHLDLSRFSFVDLGSGKGRALFIASEFPFKRIVGVEYARELHDVAVRNIGTYRNPAQRCFDIRSICDDASAYEFPVEPTICFMNNPFDEVLVAKVGAALAKRLAQSPREFMLVYLHANHPRAIEQASGWERLDQGVIPPVSPYVIWKWRGAGA
jgi:SAM-dependent methyltransferase